MGYNCFQIVCVFAGYDLFKPTTFIQIQNFIYRFSYDFDTVLNQFLETGTSDWYLVCIVLRFQPIPPFIFPLQSLPFKSCGIIITIKISAQLNLSINTLSSNLCLSVCLFGCLSWVGCLIKSKFSL